MKGTTARIFTIALFTMWVVTAAISAADAPDVDIWTAAALHTAAFFCRIETVELLLDKGADVDIRNNQGQTALEIVATEWTDVLSGAYSYYAGLLQVELDIEWVEATRPKVAAMLRQHGGKETSELNQR